MDKSVSHPLISKSIDIFKNKDHYQCHDQMRMVLKEMANDPTFWDAIVQFNFNNPEFVKRKMAIPVLDFKIANERQFTLSAHCWLPWGDKALNRSANWIHHHDNSLLTSINSFGDQTGYHSFTFNKDYKVDKATRKVFDLSITREFNHPFMNIDFVDVNVPHVVFKPAKFMITYALWSYDKPVKMDGLRSNPFIQAVKNPAKKIINLFKAEKILDIETEGDFRQFAPENGEFICVGNIQYPSLSNEDFINNALWILQQTGYKNESYLLKIKDILGNNNLTNQVALIDNLMSGKNFDMADDSIHRNNKGINFSMEDMMAAAHYTAKDYVKV